MRLGLLPGGISGSGGPGTYVTGLVRALAQQPHVQVEPLLLGLRYLTPRGWAEQAAIRELLGPGVGAACGRPVGRRLHKSRLRPLLPRYDRLFGEHDVYHQTHLDVDPLCDGRRLVVTLHDLVAERWSDEGQLLPSAVHLLQRAAAVITVSATSRRLIQERFPQLEPHRLHVIWNGVDHSRFRPQPLPDERQQVDRLCLPERYLLYVGGLSSRKNVQTLLKAHQVVRTLLPDVPDLVLVGPWGPGRMSAAQQLEGVVVLGGVPPAAVPVLMRGATAVVLPSRDEGFGLPVLEAQACGAPVLCSDIEAFTEIGGEAPYYLDTSGVDPLVADLLRCLPSLEAERARRALVGTRHASQFSWDRSAAAHRRVYDDVARQADAF